MAKQIVRKVRFDFQTSNLEKISKTIEEMKPILGKKEIAAANQIQSQIETILKSMETNQGLFSADGVKLIRSEIDKISKSFRGLTDGFQLDPAILKEQNKLLEKEAGFQEKILENKKEIARLEKDISGLDEHGFPKASRALSQSNMPLGAAVSATTGNELQRFSAWETSMMKVQEIFEELGIDSSNLEASLQKQHSYTEKYTELAEKLGVALPFEGAVVQMDLFNETMNKSGLQASASQERIEWLGNEIGDLDRHIEDALFQVGMLNVDLQSGEGVTDYQRKLSRLREEVLNLSIGLKENAGKAADGFHAKLKEGTKEVGKLDKKVNDHAGKGPQSTVGKAAKNVITYGSVYALLRKAYRETIRTVTDLDKALTDMAVVTTMSRKEAWELTGTFQELAKETGTTTTEIANLSTIYFRQGRALKDVIELTSVAAKAAKIAGISAEESANYLTAAINGFGLAAREAETMADRFAALAASSASSYEELAVGLSKFASQANLAGLSVDFALGLLAKGVETTREAPESIGTALKTVLARMRELTDLGKTMEDGMDVNRVDTALRQIGVSLRNASGEFRDMESVLTEVGLKWDTLTSNQQANVAVSLAGTRQQSRLIAMFQDFDRTLDLVNISLESEGAALAQHSNYMDGMEASMTQLTTAWQGFINSIVESDIVIGIVKVISIAIEDLSKLMNAFDGRVGGVVFTLAGLFAVVTLLVGAYRALTALKIKDAVVSAAQNVAAAATYLWSKLTGKALIEESLYLGVATKAWTAKWAAALGPIGLVVAGVAAVGYGLYRLFKGRKDANEELEKENDLLKKNRYELSQVEKKNKDIAEQGRELQNTLFKDDEYFAKEEEYQDLLIEQLETLKEQGYTTKEIAYTADGRFDMESNIKAVQEAQAEIEKEQIKNAQDLTKNARERYQLLLKSKNLTKNDLIEFAKDNKDIIALSSRDEGLLGDMTQEEQRVYFNLEDAFLSGLDADDLKKWYDGGLKSDFTKLAESTAETLDFQKLLGSEEDFDKQIELYRENIKKYSKEQQKVIKDEFKVLDLMAESYAKGFGNILGDVDFSSDAAQKVADELDTDKMRDLFNQVGKAMSGGTGRVEAWSDAIKEAAGDNVELQNILWEFASRDVSKLVVAYDSLAGRVSNVSKKQKEFLSGDMGLYEAEEFLKEYSEILEDEKLFERFKNGGDLTLYYSKKLMEEAGELDKELADLMERRELGEEGLDEEIRRLELLTLYKGEFANLTQAQIEYNQLKEKEDTLNKLGLLTDEKRAEIQEVRRKGSLEFIDELGSEAEEYLNEIDDIEKGLYKIVDGVAVVNKEAFDKLSKGQKDAVTEWLDSYNNLTREQLQFFVEYMDEETKKVEEANKKKKESYEKYFKALDRLEQKRDRRMTRDQIVQQLQRLEGASDERSRQKAKELRKELNELDAETSKIEQQEAREDLIASLDDQLKKQKEQMSESAQDILNAMTEGGSAAATAFAEAFDSITFDPETGKFGGLKQFRQGGMVDYTGIAMLHGSPGRPEAVLSADQTVAFKKLAEGLSNNKNFSSSDGITIGNITIQTNSMNNSQDFKAAGRALAREFEAAISRRGIGVNTKR